MDTIKALITYSFNTNRTDFYISDVEVTVKILQLLLCEEMSIFSTQLIEFENYSGSQPGVQVKNNGQCLVTSNYKTESKQKTEMCLSYLA